MKNVEQQIEEYLLNQMDEKAREAFEKRLQEEPALQEELERQKKVYAFLKDERNKIKEMAANLAPLGEELLQKQIQKQKVPIRERITVPNILVVVGVLLFLTIVWLMRPLEGSESELIASYLPEKEKIKIDIERGAGVELIAEHQELNKQAITAFNQKKYEEALMLWKQIPDSVQIAEMKFQQGLAHSYLEQFESAKTFLIQSRKDPYVKDESNFYLIYIYGKLGEVDFFEKAICDYAGEFYPQKVKVLKEGLKISCEK